MKAFEKWWVNNWKKCDYAHNVDAKIVWRAALEWVKSNRTRPDNIDERDWFVIRAGKIEQELEAI